MFFGSVNPNADDSYLIDPTGNRRFWPVTITKVDIEAIKRDRDQLWAEAVVAYRKGEKWWFTDAEVLAAAEDEQEARMAEDSWQSPIAKWVHAIMEVPIRFNEKDELVITTYEVLVDCLEFKAKDINKMHENRVAICLKRLGFEHRRLRDGHKRKRAWVLPAKN